MLVYVIYYWIYYIYWINYRDTFNCTHFNILKWINDKEYLINN